MSRAARLLFVALALGPTFALTAEAPDKDALTQQELAKLEAGIGKARSAVADLDKEKRQLSQQLQQQEQSILQMQQRLTLLDSETSSIGDSLRQLEQQRQTLEQDRLQQQQWLANYLRGAWRNGNQEFFKVLLSQQDTSRSARLLQYYQYFAEARRSQLVTYQALLENLATTTTQIQEHTATLSLQQQELLKQQSALRDQQQQRQTLLQQLDDDLAREGAKLNGLEQQRIERQLLLEELRQARAAQQRAEQARQFAKQQGKLPWPVKGRIANRFGTRHELGDLTYEGITIAAEAGTTIKAVHGGRVVFADWFSNSGLLLIIDHGDGFMSLYAHNQELLQKVGAVVDGGEAIAKVGNTGGQQQSGLYFEIRRDGKAENPVSWLAPDK